MSIIIIGPTDDDDDRASCSLASLPLFASPYLSKINLASESQSLIIKMSIVDDPSIHAAAAAADAFKVPGLFKF